MTRHSYIAALVVGLGIAVPANAQSRPAPVNVEVQHIRAEIEKMRVEIKQLEVKLQRLESSGSRERRPGQSLPGGTTQFGGIASGFGSFPGGTSSFGGGRGGFSGSSFGGGLASFGRGGESGSFSTFSRTAQRRPAPEGRSDRSRDDFDRRLDRIIRELEQLRRDSHERPR